MGLPAASAVRGARAAGERMANRATPSIHDEWYVVASAEEVGNALLKRGSATLDEARETAVHHQTARS